MSEMSKILTPRKRSFCAAGMRGFLSLSLSSPAGGGGSGGNPWTPQSSRPFGISTDMNSRFLYTDTSPCPPGHTMEVTNLALERSEEHTSELQSHSDLVCRLLLEKKKKKKNQNN